MHTSGRDRLWNRPFSQLSGLQDIDLDGYVLPVVMKSLFHGTGSVTMDVRHLPLLARLSGTLCPRTCGIRMFLRTVTGSHWRRFYLRSTSVFSALEVFFTRMRYINLHLTLTCGIPSWITHQLLPIYYSSLTSEKPFVDDRTYGQMLRPAEST